MSPLTTRASLPPTVLFETHWKAAEYLAFVALRGRYAYCREPRGWYRHDGVEWRRVHPDDVRVALRRACADLNDQLAGDPRYSPGRFRLIDLNWVFRELDVMRRIVTVPAERLGVENG